MAKAERISPSSSGTSQRARCCGVANRCSNSMLPVSGALQLNTSEAQDTRPMISASGAYSRLLRRVPGSSSPSAGRNRFHSPSLRAKALRSAMNGTGNCPAATLCCQAPMRGTMWASMKLRSC
ncbi:hypothetical protein D9M68_819220 [compost metagenome]